VKLRQQTLKDNFMSIELMTDDDIDMDVVQYECWYWSVIDSMADLIMNNGRDRVMADVAETVLKRLGEGYVLPVNDELLP
jgi:hypothetical protein